MTATTQATQLPPNPSNLLGNKIKSNIIAFLIDTFLWAYTALVSWKIIYEKY